MRVHIQMHSLLFCVCVYRQAQNDPKHNHRVTISPQNIPSITFYSPPSINYPPPLDRPPFPSQHPDILIYKDVNKRTRQKILSTSSKGHCIPARDERVSLGSYLMNAFARYAPDRCFCENCQLADDNECLFNESPYNGHGGFERIISD